MPARDESAKLAAVIAAAIYPCSANSCIVDIGEARPAAGWTAGSRARLHAPHAAISAFKETGIGPQSLINLAGVFGFDELRTKSSEAITMAR
jgi:hypothetical protein